MSAVQGEAVEYVLDGHNQVMVGGRGVNVFKTHHFLVLYEGMEAYGKSHVNSQSVNEAHVEITDKTR